MSRHNYSIKLCDCFKTFCTAKTACDSIIISCETATVGCTLQCTIRDSCDGGLLTCGAGYCYVYCPSYGDACKITVDATLSSSYQCSGIGCPNVVLYTADPTPSPTTVPTDPPTSQPTYQPSESTDTPSIVPTHLPSNIPSNDPTSSPLFPTYIPSYIPSKNPSLFPTFIPSKNPSAFPTHIPIYIPSKNPSSYPTYIPSGDPSLLPTYLSSYIPSIDPTSNNIQNRNWTGINISSNSSTSDNILVWIIISGACVLIICAIVSVISLYTRKKREKLHATKGCYIYIPKNRKTVLNYIANISTIFCYTFSYCVQM